MPVIRTVNIHVIGGLRGSGARHIGERTRDDVRRAARGQEKAAAGVVRFVPAAALPCTGL